MWNSKKINELRLKLGWSRVELCHRLGVTLVLLNELEKNEIEIDKEMTDSLNKLAMVAEKASDHIHKSAKMDSHMKENNLSKIIVDKGKEEL